MIPTPSAGKLRSSLRFERQGAVTNVGGVAISDWSSPTEIVASRRAFVDPRKGSEEVIAGRMAGKTDYTIWVRFDPKLASITNAVRAVNNRTGEIYNLGQPIDPNNSRQWLLIQATSGGNANGEG